MAIGDETPEDSGSRSLPAWDQVQDFYRQHFPGLDESQMRRQYEHARELRGARERHADWEPPLVHRVIQGTFLGGIHNTRIEVEHGRAAQRIQRGEGTRQDYDALAQYERNEQIEGRRSPLEQIGHIGVHAAGMASEAAVGSGLLRGASNIPYAGAPLRWAGLGAEAAAPAGIGGRIAQFGLRTAAQTAATPSMYAPEWAQGNIEQGRDPLDIRGLPRAYALGAIQTALLGTIGQQVNARLPGPGLGRALTRMGVAGPVGVAEQAVADALAGAAKLQTGYGALGDLWDAYKGKDGALDAAWKKAVTSALTFGAFAAIHEATPGHRPRVGERPNREAAERPVHEMADRLKEMHEQGVPESEALAQVASEMEANHGEKPPEAEKTAVFPQTPRVDSPMTPEQAAQGLTTEQARIAAEGRNARTGTTQPEAPQQPAVRPEAQVATPEPPRAPEAKPELPPPAAAEPAKPPEPVQQPQAAPAPSAPQVFIPEHLPAKRSIPAVMAKLEEAGFSPRDREIFAYALHEGKSLRQMEEHFKDTHDLTYERIRQILDKQGEALGLEKSFYKEVFAGRTGTTQADPEFQGTPAERAEATKRVARKLAKMHPADRFEFIKDRMIDHVTEVGPLNQKQLREYFKIAESAGVSEAHAKEILDAAEALRARAADLGYSRSSVAKSLREIPQADPLGPSNRPSEVRQGNAAAAGTPEDIGGGRLPAARDREAVLREFLSEGFGELEERESVERVLKGKGDAEDRQLVDRLLDPEPLQREMQHEKQKLLEEGTNAKRIAEAVQDGLSHGNAATAAPIGARVPGGKPRPEPVGAAESSTSPRGLDSGGPAPGGFGRPLTPEETRGMVGGGQENIGPARPPKETALAREVVGKEREKAGLDALEQQAKQANPKSWEIAQQRLAADPAAGEKLADALLKNPHLATTVEDGALLLHRRIALRNEYERTINRFVEGHKNKMPAKELDAISRQAEDLEVQINNADQASDYAGSEIGRALQFRRQLAKHDFSLAGLLQKMKAANPNRPVTDAEKIELAELHNRIKDLEGKLQTAEDKWQKAGGGIEGEGYGDWLKANSEANNAKGEINRKIAKRKWETLNVAEKSMWWLKKIFVTNLISSPITLGKIGASSVLKVGTAPIYEAIGKGWSLLPGIRQTSANAPSEGRGLHLPTEAAALKATITQGAADAAATMRYGKSQLDHDYGRPDDGSPRTPLDLVGDSHSALKAFAVRNAFVRAQSNILAHEKALGQDTTSPAAVHAINARAYAESQKAKYQQDNFANDWFDKIVNAAKRHENPIVNIGGHVLDLAIPIRKVPTNIVLEALEHALGLPGAAIYGAGVKMKGKQLTPEQSDTIMRMLKKGTAGLPLLALGYWLGPQMVGGLYSGRRREDELKPGEIDTKLGTVPSWVTAHHPAAMIFHLGASARREDEKIHRGQPAGRVEAGAHALGSLLEEIPFVREQHEYLNLFQGERINRLAKSAAIPAVLDFAAKRLDTEEKNVLTGTPVHRRPQGLIQHLQMGVPALRQKVPQ